MLKLVYKFKGLILIGLVFGGLFTVRAATVPPPNAPLPVPDVIFYGTATVEGEVLQTGTVQAIMPRGGRVSATIAPIQGTDYNYALAVPLNVFDDLNTAILPMDAIVFSDMLYFTINGADAYYVDADDLDVRAFTIPTNAMGETYVLDLMIANPDDYRIGDVNVNGYRDVADALLILRYSVGFVAGDENFPPAQGRPYLPLCDIVVDGLCNDSDALRILQCDAGLPGVPCLPEASPPVTLTQSLGASLMFHLQVAPALGQALTRTVQVIASDTERRLAAASLELRYNPDQLTVSCTADPLAVLDADVCYAAGGSARLNGVAINGTGSNTVLAELTFAPVDAHSLETLEAQLDLQVNGAFDLDGQILAWTSSRLFTSHLFLPLMFHNQAP